MWLALLGQIIAPLVLGLLKAWQDRREAAANDKTKLDLTAAKLEVKALRWHIRATADPASAARLRSYDAARPGDTPANARKTTDGSPVRGGKRETDLPTHS
jgi:hypothetical protein